VNLNQDIYKIGNHHKYKRVFFPVVRLKQESLTENNRVETYGFGVIEAGIKKSLFQKNNTNRLSELAIYIDNLAQPYFRNGIIEQKEEITSCLQNIDRKYLQKSSEYKELLQEILMELTIGVNAYLGVLCFNSNGDIEKDNSSEINHPIKEAKICSLNEKDKELFLSRVKKTKDKSFNENEYTYKEFRKIWFRRTNKTENYRKNTSKDFQNIWISDSAPEEVLLVPLIYSDHIIGICKLYAPKVNHFSVQKTHYVENFLSKAVTIILRKKLDYFISKIILPFNLVDSNSNNEALFIRSLQQYFITPFVSIWIKNGQGKYEQKYRSEFLPELNSTIEKELFPKELGVVKRNTQENAIPFENIQIENLIRMPIKFHDFNFGFIHVYLNKNLDITSGVNALDNRCTDSIFVHTQNYLNSIANKISASLQSHMVTQLVTEIARQTANLEISQHKALYEFIIHKAKYLLHANYVDIFLRKGMSDEIENINQETCDLHLKRKGDTMLKENIEQTQRIHEPESTPSLSSILLPIISKGIVNGVLAVQYKGDFHLNESFNEYLQLLTSLISPSKLLIDHLNQNKRLYQENSRMLKPVFEGLLISGTIHNVSNNFSSLNAKYKTYVQSIKYEARGSGKLYKALAFMENLAETLDALDKDLKKLERYWANNKMISAEFFDLKDLMQECQLILADRPEGERIDLYFFQKEKIIVKGDFDALRNVIINLVINSFQAIKSISRNRKGIVRVISSILPSKTYVRIRVEDNGPGVPKERLEEIWLPYKTSKEETGGTGLGLAISKYVIENGHFGKIRYISSEKKGAIFEIDLKYHKKEHE